MVFWRRFGRFGGLSAAFFKIVFSLELKNPKFLKLHHFLVGNGGFGFSHFKFQRLPQVGLQEVDWQGQMHGTPPPKSASSGLIFFLFFFC